MLVISKRRPRAMRLADLKLLAKFLPELLNPLNPITITYHSKPFHKSYILSQLSKVIENETVMIIQQKKFIAAGTTSEKRRRWQEWQYTSKEPVQ